MSILSLFGSPLIRYGALALTLLSLVYMKYCEIKREAYLAGKNAVLTETLKVKHVRKKKARSARRNVHSNSLRKGRDPYRRD
ncbi:MAG: hypothetical protein JJ964_05860 [Rhizobiales bacterium]|nr:hypothetical protein [Hyphomicrobiales bacterium]